MFAEVVIPRTPLDELTYFYRPEEIGELHPGALVSLPLRNKTVSGVVFQIKAECAFSKNQIQPISRVLAHQVLSEDLIKLARWTADYYRCHLGDVLELMIPPRLTSAVDFSTAVFEPAVSSNYPLKFEPGAGFEQRFAENRFRVWFSGMRENFLKLITPFIRQRFKFGSVIVLMPEPGLEEFLPLLRAEFGGAVIEYHHRLNKKQQQIAWYSIVNRSNLLVAGVRSAVWVPVKDLAGVVVINENAASFKEERMPCYHARDVAIARARLSCCPVLLFGAPPSVETWWNVKNRQFKLLDQVNFGPARQNVFVVDMRLHRKEIISPRLVRDLKNVVQQQKTAICYINRRGLSRYVLCEDCGTVLRCSHCQLPLILNVAGKVWCRLCGYEGAAPERCVHCQGTNFSYRAPGADMVVQKLRQMGIKAINITCSARNQAISPSFSEESGYMPVLVGTRALLHQHAGQFDGLVALINFDTEFVLPDFRSRERAFALLISILQRKPDRLVIQTSRPEDPVLDFALKGDVAGFLDWELQMRAEANFPPYTRLITITCSGDEKELSSGLADINQQLEKIPGVELLGPIKLLRPRSIGAHYRLILKFPRNVLPAQILSKEFLKVLPGRVRIDVDPLEIL
jgi:primosomal protein N' (replication factor Y)